jgi:hypothetical protein
VEFGHQHFDAQTGAVSQGYIALVWMTFTLGARFANASLVFCPNAVTPTEQDNKGDETEYEMHSRRDRHL